MLSRRVRRLLRRCLHIEDADEALAAIEKDLKTPQLTDPNSRNVLENFPELLEELEEIFTESDEQVKMAIRNLQISSTELNESNRMLESMNEANTAMLDNLGQGLLTFDGQGVCGPAYSKACLYMLGGSPAGRHVCEYLRFTPTQRNQMETLLSLLFHGKTHAMPVEDVIGLAPQDYEHPEGLHINLSYRPIRDRFGLLTSVLLIATDRTQAVRAQEKMQHNEALLYHAQKMEAVGQLTSGIAHDFNTTLSIILSGSSLMRRKLQAGDPPVQYLLEKITDIEVAARAGAELVRNLMIFSRQRTVKPEVTNINSCISEAVQLLKGPLGALVNIEMKLSDDLWPVLVDRGQLQHALINLAVNARDAMPQGGTITVETRNVLIDRENGRVEPGRLSGEAVMITIADTGAGIPKDIRDRIFDPFFTTKAPGDGTGLGLSLVYGFVKDAKGNIEVGSEEGRGTVFRLCFPRNLSETMPREEERNMPADMHILVVEDNETLRRLLCENLQECGFTVSQAQDGQEAINLIEAAEAPPHVVLTDLIMPRKEGLAVIVEIRKKYPGIRMIAMSGGGRNKSADFLQMASKLGADSILEKPIEIVDLERVIRSFAK